jgi:hypothetical protein
MIFSFRIEISFIYGEYRQFYWTSSRGQPTGGSSLALELGGGLTASKNCMLQNVIKIHKDSIRYVDDIEGWGVVDQVSARSRVTVLLRRWIYVLQHRISPVWRLDHGIAHVANKRWGWKFRETSVGIEKNRKIRYRDTKEIQCGTSKGRIVECL